MDELISINVPVVPVIAPYAGFYANMVACSELTKVVFLVEFSLLLLMGIVMYGIHMRERRLKSKIKFTGGCEIHPSTCRNRIESLDSQDL